MRAGGLLQGQGARPGRESSAGWGRSLNHQDGLLDNGFRYQHAKSLGGFETDTHIHTRRSLDRKIARLGALENLVYQSGRPAVHIKNVSSIRDKPTTLNEEGPFVDGRQLLFRRALSNLLALDNEHRIYEDDESFGPLLYHGRERRIKVIGFCCLDHLNLHA